ncbi:MAG: hypothetical protein GY769_20025 [bacterium]|nr:hypothetical protein [bacterium]
MTTAFGQILTTTEMNVAADGVTADFVNSLNTNDNVNISRTFVGGGRGLFVDMGPGGQAVTGNAIEVALGTGSTGHGLRVDLAAGATGDGLHIVDAGDGPAIFANKTSGTGSLLDLQISGTTAMGVSAAGAVNVNAGANILQLLADSGSMEVTTTIGGAGTAGDIDILSDSSTAGATSGDVSLASISSGLGTTGGVVLQAGGASVPAASAGVVSIDASVSVDLGTSAAVAVNSGSGTTRWTHSGILDLTSASSAEGGVNIAELIELNSTGTGAETASIFIGDADPDGNVTSGDVGSLFLDAATPALYQKTGAPSTWSAFGAGAGNTLQQAYAAGNTIAVTTANGAVAMSNSADTTDVLTIDRSFAGSGDGIDINMGATTTGRGVRVVAGGSGTGVLVTDGVQDQTGISPGLIFQSSGNDLDISILSGTGAAGNLSATAGTSTTVGTAGGTFSADGGTGAVASGGSSGAAGGPISVAAGVGGAGAAGGGETGGSGGLTAVRGGIGGLGGGVGSGSGGLITVAGGPGGVADATSAGSGGSAFFVGGAGGAATAAIAGGAGGGCFYTGGSGGAGTATGAAGAGGLNTITGGNAGTDGGGGGAAGADVLIAGGGGSGGSVDGDVNIGPSVTQAITIGNGSLPGDVSVLSGGSSDITFDSRGATSAIPFNGPGAGDVDLVGFTATSVIGALNELAAGGAVPSLDTVMTTGTPDNTVALAAAAAATAGEDISLTAGAGGVGTGTDGGTGGAAVYVAGAGGANDGSTDDGGVGGAGTITAGAGGAATGAGRTGGVGGDLSVAAGAGGDSASFGDGDGGNLTLSGGDAGSTGIFDGDGGDVTITGGDSAGAGGSRLGGSVNLDPGFSGTTDGDVNIATTVSTGAGDTSINIGNSTDNPSVNIVGSLDINRNAVGIPLDVTGGASVNNPSFRLSHASTSSSTSAESAVRLTSSVAGTTADPRYPLLMDQATRAETVNYGEFIQMRTSGTGADEASIFLGDADPDGNVTEGELGSLFIDAVNATLYQKTGAPSTWTAFGAGGVSDLQGAYAGGNTIAVTTANGTVDISNSADSTDLMQLDRTNTGSGDGIQISMSPGGESQSGFGINMSLGTGHTTAGVGVNSTATANIACFNAVQGASSSGAGYRAFMTSGGTGDALSITDGTETTRINMDDFIASQAFTFATDDNALTDGSAGFLIQMQPGAGSDNAAGSGGSGGTLSVVGGTGGTGSGANLGGDGGGSTHTGGTGGTSATGQGGDGGLVQMRGGVGAVVLAAGTFGGSGGDANVIGGIGGASAAALAGREGGFATLQGGAGGANTGGTGTSGAGGAIIVVGGAAGADNGGTGAAGGDVAIRGGAGTGAAADGDITIGDFNTNGIGFFGATPVGQSSAYTPTNVTTDRSFDANSTSLNELADVVGTMIADLQATGLFG